MRLGILGLCLLVVSCATHVQPGEGRLLPTISFQSNELNPSNGGQLITGEALRPGDIILTADNGLNSASIRLITQSPVSHALLYLGNQQVAEAVGEGIRRRSVADLLADEVTIVAFRHPRISEEHMSKIDAFVAKHLGQKYNYMGIMLQSPFVIERRVCELPLVPSLVRDFCIRGIAAIQLGLGRNDQFFCSQFVLEAYRQAGLALTSADPRLISPADLLHMREGDVPSVRIDQALQYVGHMKIPSEPVAMNKISP
jgi:Permuted papain-like amidase enzyme, YaeF/YiiX, C92 family